MPAEGLVEQHQPRLQHQRTGELEQHALSAGEVRGLLVGEIGDVEEVQVSLRPPDQGDPIVGAGIAGRETRGEHVLERRHVREDPRDLEGTSDAGPGDLVRRRLLDGLALEPNRARVERIDPAGGIQQRGLAGTVRADETDELALRHGERHRVQRLVAAECKAALYDFEYRLLLSQRSIRPLIHPALHERPPCPDGAGRNGIG